MKKNILVSEAQTNTRYSGTGCIFSKKQGGKTMSYGERRTDLAVEARELWRRSAADTDALAGVEAFETQEQGFGVTTVQVLNEEGEKKLCKPGRCSDGGGSCADP